MEVLEKEKVISVNAGRGLPIREIIEDAGIVLILIWGIFIVLVFFFSLSGREVLPYFIGITLLLVIPLVLSILIRQSRHYAKILFDGERGVVMIKGVWRWRQVSFNDIKGFQVNRYRFQRDLFLHRLDLILSSGKTLRLIQDVPDEGALFLLGKKVRDLVKKPLNIYK